MLEGAKPDQFSIDQQLTLTGLHMLDSNKQLDKLLGGPDPPPGQDPLYSHDKSNGSVVDSIQKSLIFQDTSYYFMLYMHICTLEPLGLTDCTYVKCR